MTAARDPHPCELDARDRGTDWTKVPDRDEAERMAAICQTDCRHRLACYRAALAERPHTVGVWAGLVWLGGRVVDVRDDARKRRSVYPGVAWDSSRGKWKAYVMLPRSAGPNRMVNLGRFDDEEDAADAASAARVEHGLDEPQLKEEAS